MSKLAAYLFLAVLAGAGILHAAQTPSHGSTATGCGTFLDLGLSAGGGQWDYFHKSEGGSESAEGYTRIATLYNRAGNDDKIYGGLTADYSFHEYCGP